MSIGGFLILKPGVFPPTSFISPLEIFSQFLENFSLSNPSPS